MRAVAFGLAALLLCVTQLSCSVNEYCLGCAVDDGGASSGDGNDGGSDGGLDDGGMDAMCVPTGTEICDGMDNDCNGLTDDGTLPQVGSACPNQTGPCAGGKFACTTGALKCDKPPMPEECDLIDNNCNGMVDEGDPGGGAKCGTEMGECVAGTNACDLTTGTVECFGFQDHTNDPELCDGKDNDCNGVIDDGMSNLGTCGPATDNGECEFGTGSCSGGAIVCMGAKFPTFETCNDLDDDCDGTADQIFSKQTDPNHCGTCATVCQAPSKTCINSTNAGTVCTMSSDCTGGPGPQDCVANSQRRCTTGTCGFSCNAGFVNLDAQDANGCEYRCSPTGSEECDGIDNNCNGMVDEGLTPPTICAQGGECGTTMATCSGAGGWVCNYLGMVQFPETKCDDKDNDCDTRFDEGQPNLDAACDDGRVGVCKGTGTYDCDMNDLDGPAVCKITMAGQTNPDLSESCDGKDNDCDGNTDENASDNFVEVRDPGNVLLFKIYTYEASRPDASSTSVGTIGARSCSRAGVLPWSSVTYAQAAAACAAVDPPRTHLCTAAEWQLACESNAGLKYPYGNTYLPNACNGNDYDPNCTAPDDDRALPSGAPHGCPTKPGTSACLSTAGAFDLSGNLKEWTATPVGGSFEIRGGAFDTVASGMTCNFDFVTASPNFSFANLGFRCCSTP